MDFERLIQQPESLRDDQWEQDFLRQFATIKVQIEAEEVRQGPDGWPYLFVKTAAEGTEPVAEVMSWLASRGIGLVVNAHKMVPDYVFPYGMIWNFVEAGRFLQPTLRPPAGEVVFEPEKKLIMGPPSEKYLPPYVRTLLKEFLHSKGFTEPKVLVISSGDYREVDLAISIESLNGLQPEKRQSLAEMLAWFLPLHYALVLAPQQGLPEFSDL